MTIKRDNGNVHRAAAKIIVSKSRAARGSVCNVLLSGLFTPSGSVRHTVVELSIILVSASIFRRRLLAESLAKDLYHLPTNRKVSNTEKCHEKDEHQSKFKTAQQNKCHIMSRFYITEE